jgi:hypothetical protein
MASRPCVRVERAGEATMLIVIALTFSGLEALSLVMRYILRVNDHVEPEALQAFLDRAVGPQAKDTIMTAGDRLIEQGIQQRLPRERMILLRLLRQRFGDEVNTDIERRLATASAEQIDTWAEREVSAVTLAELFAD